MYEEQSPSYSLTFPCPVSPCRYLVEAPPNVCTPTHLAEAAHHIAQRFPSTMTLKVGAGSGRFDSAALSLNSLRQRIIAASCLLEDAVCEAIRTGRWPSPPLYMQVIEKAACEALGMGSYLGVSEASDEPPKFIHLTYRPGGVPPAAGNKVLALVGKGLTFDSGGYNMKVGPGSMIELMKVCVWRGERGEGGTLFCNLSRW